MAAFGAARAPGLSAQEAFEKAEPLFRFPVGGVVSAGPEIAGDLCWVMSDSKTLYALTVEGKAVGRRAMTARRSAYLVCDDFGRAAVSDGSTLSVVNRAGSEVWGASLPTPLAGKPVFASDGRLFVAAGRSLSAYAPGGRLLWRRALESEPASSPVIGPGGGPAIGLSGGVVLLFSPDGSAPARAELGSDALFLAATPERLAAALADGRLVALGAESGPAGGALAAPSPAGGSGAGKDGEPGGAASTVDSTRSDGARGAAGKQGSAAPAVGSSGADGARGAAAAPRLPSRPVALASSPDGFYALGEDGTLLAVDPDGTFRWSMKTQAASGGTALAAFAGKVVALSRDSARSFGADGSPYRTLRLEHATTLPAIAASGVVLAGGEDWILYAYRFERPLSPGDEPRVASIGMEAVDRAADEYAAWTPFASEEATVMARLADIEKSLKSDTIPIDESRTIGFLAAVALGRVGAPFGAGAVRPGPAPGGAMPRAYACGLLGLTGLSQALPFLVEAFESDADPAVKASAAAGVAMIGLDPEGRAMGAFSRIAETGSSGPVAQAVVDAIEALYAAAGGLDDRTGVLALIRIAGGDFPRDVRAKAEKALARIAKGRR